MAEQTALDYEAREWANLAAGGTELNAAALQKMDDGIAGASKAVDDLRTKRLPTYVVLSGGDTATTDAYTEPILGPCLILDLATRTTYYETGGDEEGHRKAITSGDDIDDLRDSLSRAVVIQSTVSDAYVSDMNSRGCPALTITSTATGHRVGIYAQDGLGFVLYDFTEMRRIGLCSFDQLQLSLSRTVTVRESVASSFLMCDTSHDQLLVIGCQPKDDGADKKGIVVYDDRLVIYNFTKQQALHTLTQPSLSRYVWFNTGTISAMRATNNLPIGAVLQLIFTEKQTGTEYTFMVFDDGVGLYDNDTEEYIWSNRGLTQLSLSQHSSKLMKLTVDDRISSVSFFGASSYFGIGIEFKSGETGYIASSASGVISAGLQQPSLYQKYDLKTRPGDVFHTISFDWERKASVWCLVVYVDDKQVAFIHQGFDGQLSLSQCIRYFTDADTVDLNDLTANGLHSYNNPENRPSGSGGWVNTLVSRMNNSPDYVCQIAMASNGVFYRRASSGVWAEWSRLQLSLSHFEVTDRIVKLSAYYNESMKAAILVMRRDDGTRYNMVLNDDGGLSGVITRA